MRLKIVEAPYAVERFAYHKHRPPLAHYFERPRYRAIHARETGASHTRRIAGFNRKPTSSLHPYRPSRIPSMRVAIMPQGNSNETLLSARLFAQPPPSQDRAPDGESLCPTIPANTAASWSMAPAARPRAPT